MLAEQERRALEDRVWAHAHRDFRYARPDGTRWMLHYNQKNCATESWPLTSFSDEQLLGKLPCGRKT